MIPSNLNASPETGGRCNVDRPLGLGTALLLAFIVSVLAISCAAEADPTPKPDPTGAQSSTPEATPNVEREIARGKLLSQQNGCLGCHTVDGRDQVGPTWLGLYGSVEEIEGGTSVQVDDQYLIESIRDPNAQVVRGYRPNIMPPFGIDDDGIDAIIAYIRSLQ